MKQRTNFLRQDVFPGVQPCNKSFYKQLHLLVICSQQPSFRNFTLSRSCCTTLSCMQLSLCSVHDCLNILLQRHILNESMCLSSFLCRAQSSHPCVATRHIKAFNRYISVGFVTSLLFQKLANNYTCDPEPIFSYVPSRVAVLYTVFSFIFSTLGCCTDVLYKSAFF